MPKIVQVRELTAEEQAHIEQVVHSRTAAVREVERARIVWYSTQGKRVPEIARLLNLGQAPVRLWLKRFNERGGAGLADEKRCGRPATYTAEQVSLVILTAMTEPKSLDLPFASWTLDRLQG